MEVPLEIRLRYVERRRRDLEQCFEHFENSDYRFLEKIGHQLKGNGATFGYPDLAGIGGRLEFGAQSGDLQIMLQAMERFSEWVSEHLS